MSRAFGLSLYLLILTVCVALFVPAASYVAGCFAIVCLLTGILSGNNRAPQLVALLLTLAGILFFAIAASLSNMTVEFSHLLRLNQDLAGMISCVTFLRLITPENTQSHNRVKGKAAIFQTAYFTTLIGSVVNIVAVGLVAEEVRRGRKLTVTDASLLANAYASGAFWSPFWVAAAAASQLMPGANTPLYLIFGAAAAIIFVAVATAINIRGRDQTEVQGYTGYQLSWPLLRIPLALVGLVLIGHEVLPHASIPKLVIFSALFVTIFGLAFKHGWNTPKVLTQQALLNLSKTKSEVSLFIAAGVFTIGVSAAQSALNLQLPLPEFTAWTAWGMLLLGILLSVCGIHPIVSLSIFVGLLAGSSPDPTLFILAMTLCWGLASSAGPVSGITNYMNGQFGVPSLKLVLKNMPTVFVGSALALPLLLLLETVLLAGA